MNEISMHVAESTRTELDRTNALYYPIHNMWMMISFLILAAYFAVDAMIQIKASALLMLSTMALLPAVGVGIKQATLVKRSWTLWIHMIGNPSMNPDGTSKMLVAASNIIGSNIFGFALLLINWYEMAAHTNVYPYNRIQAVCSLIVGVGFNFYVLAETHKPKFSRQDSDDK